MTGSKPRPCNEKMDKFDSFHSFYSVVVRKQHSYANPVGKNKTLSADDTATASSSTCDASFTTTSSTPAGVSFKYDNDGSYEVEYCLAEFESKLYLEDINGRMEEPIIEELYDDDSRDEFEEENDTGDEDEEQEDSIVSLNSLEKEGLDDKFVTENCKLLAPPTTMMGCLGLVEQSMGIFGRQDDDEVNEAYCNGDFDMMRSTTTEKSCTSDGVEESKEEQPPCSDDEVNEAYCNGHFHIMHPTTKEQSCISVGVEESKEEPPCSAHGTFEVREISFAKHHDDGINLTDDEALLVDPYKYENEDSDDDDDYNDDDDDDDDDDRYKLEPLIILETESIFSDDGWGEDDDKKVEADDHDSSDSSSDDENTNASLILTCELNFVDDDEEASN
ncbi:unnamed protein product [Cylindrotheca closterium]|uniref:Uncharacterized protein n=1 Tax=Cylindrotheca closterium TaxID=2856 RepID=A0AAD2FNA7_9STRA|nr:unnamed protein product [Cylindrotheca closterium]